MAAFLPFVQSLLYSLLVGSPGVVQWTVVALLIAVVAVARGSWRRLQVAAGVFVVMGLFVGPIVGGVYAHTDVADRMQAEATELETLPNTSSENVRVLPRNVSDNYAQSSMQYPQYRLTESDIAYVNGSYRWSHGITPDNLFVSLFGNQQGAMYVNMTTTQKDIEVNEQTFRNGRGQLLFDSYQYQSVLHAPFKEHNWRTTFNARSGDTPYIAHSTTTYEWRFELFPVSQLYSVPQHGSVEVMYPNGSITSLSPSEATSSALLRGQNVYPYDLAMFEVRSMQYIHGPINKWFVKEDVLAIADLPEAGNTWPLTVPTENESPELTYFIATEPTGGGNGVYEIWTIDGQTGEAAIQRYDDSQLGPQKAVDFTERLPQVNRLSNAQAVSPVPIVKEDTLYWHVKVVPQSSSGLVYTAFVNAESGDVTLVEDTRQIYAFLTQGGGIERVRNRTDNGEATRGGANVSVVVTDGDGSIVGTRNVTVPNGGSVSIRVNDTASGSTDESTTM